MQTPEESTVAAAEAHAYSWEQIIVGLVMAVIVAITFANVVVRYFTAQSIAATEELSIALLPVLAFLGSVPAYLHDRHIRVTFFVERLPRHGASSRHGSTPSSLSPSICLLPGMRRASPTISSVSRKPRRRWVCRSGGT